MVKVDMGSIGGERDPEECGGWVRVTDEDEEDPDVTAAWVRAKTDEGVTVLSCQLSSSGSREDGMQHLEDWWETGFFFMLPRIGISTWLST